MTLEVRDRPKLIALIAVFVMFIMVVFLIIPGRNTVSKLSRAIIANEQNISKMLSLEKEHVRMRSHSMQVPDEDMGSFHILSFLDQLATAQGVQDQIISMKVINTAPDGLSLDGMTGDVVEVKLKEIQLQPLVDFLFEIEHSQKKLRVSKIHLRRQNEDTPVLEVVILVGENVSRTS